MTKHNPEAALAKATREFGEHGGVCPSIERSSTFTVLDSRTMPKIFSGTRGPESGGCYLYSRHFNPTVNVLSRYLAAMEGTETAVCTASGIAAIACALMQICKNGDHIVASNTIYGGTHALLKDLFPSLGITATFVDPDTLNSFEAAITPQTKAIFTETLGNPTLKVSDIKGLARMAHDNGALLVVDNTFTPMIVTPANLGADVVVYSLTKFVNGASDVVAGAICGKRTFINELMDLHTGRVMLLGPTMDPRAAFDVAQRLPHLGIRLREHSRRTLALAQRLEALGAKVCYPGLASHKQHNLFSEMMNPEFGYGGLLTLDCKTADMAEELMNILQNEEHFGLIAVSLGYSDTLMSCSGSSTSSEINEEDQNRMGLSPGLLRISIGYTDSLDNRISQLERAVKKAGLV